MPGRFNKIHPVDAIESTKSKEINGIGRESRNESTDAGEIEDG